MAILPNIPGQLYDTGVATIGGPGQTAIHPYPDPRHILTMTLESTHRHEDHFVTAAEAIRERSDRLKTAGTPFTRDGMTLRYVDNSGAKVTLTYQDPA